MSEDVEWTCISHPRCDLTAVEELRRRQVAGELDALGIAEPFSAQPSVQLAQRRGETSQLVAVESGETVEIAGRARCTVLASGNPADQQIVDLVAGQGFNDWSGSNGGTRRSAFEFATSIHRADAPRPLATKLGDERSDLFGSVEASSVTQDRHIVRTRRR
jgi:hypothetical protein